MRRRLTLATALGAVLLVAGCSASSGGNSEKPGSAAYCADQSVSMADYNKYCGPGHSFAGTGPETESTVPSEAASSAGPQTLQYGQTATITTDSGVVKYTVAGPEVITYHEADCCDDNNPNGAKKGKVAEILVRFSLSAEGVSGSVAIESDVQTEYKQPDGTLKDETIPLSTYEDSSPITNQPTTLGAGQKTSGQTWMNSKVTGGRYIAAVNGTPVAVWGPAS